MFGVIQGYMRSKTSRKMKPVTRQSDESITTVLYTAEVRIETVVRSSSARDGGTVHFSKDRKDTGKGGFVDFFVRKHENDHVPIARLSDAFITNTLDLEDTVQKMLKSEKWRKVIIAQVWMSGAHASE